MKCRSQKKKEERLATLGISPDFGAFLMHRGRDTGDEDISHPLKFLKIAKPIVVVPVAGENDTIDTASYAETQTHETT